MVRCGWFNISTIQFLRLLLLLLALSLTNQAQQQEKRTACYLRVSQLGWQPNDEHFQGFTERLLKLSLAGLKSLKPTTEPEPSCKENRPSAIGEPDPTLNFYVVKAVVQFHPNRPPPVRSTSPVKTEFVLQYELLKYTQCSSESLLRQTEPFEEEEALKYFENMANSVRSVLADDLAPKKTLIDVKRITTSGGRVQHFADSLTSEIVANLSETTNFQPRDAPTEATTNRVGDYTLSGNLTLKNENLSIQFLVRPEKEPSKIYSSPETTSSSLDDEGLRKFYRDAVSNAISFLNEVQYVLDARISSSLNATQLRDMLNKAKALMCEGVRGDCQAQAEAALPLLIVLSRRMADEPVVFKLLGNAYNSNTSRPEGAKAWDRYLQLPPRDDRSKFYIALFAAAAWYDLKYFERAAADYEEAIRLRPGCSPAYQGRVRSYRFAGERSKAVDAVLESWPCAKNVSQWKEVLILDLNEITINLSDGEIDQQRLDRIEQLLRENKDALPNTNGLSRVQALLTSGLISTAVNAYSRSDFAALDETLKKLESYSDRVWPVNGRQEWMQRDTVDATVLRLRGMWFRDAKGDFEKALKSLTTASQVPYNQNKLEDSYELALTYFKRAQSITGDRQSDLQQASAHLADLVDSSDKQLSNKARDLLRQVNRLLNKSVP